MTIDFFWLQNAFQYYPKKNQNKLCCL